MDFPVEDLRAHFPALALKDGGSRRVYLDNPAGTQVPRAVAEAVARCLIETPISAGISPRRLRRGASSRRRMPQWPTSSAPPDRTRSSSART